MTLSKRLRSLLLTAALPLLLHGAAHAWAQKKAPLMTPWASQVDPKHPWPNYPRPQMVRTRWMNLNGIWQYQPGHDGDAVPTQTKLSSEILVPFAVESALSGVMEHHDRLWYRRSFTVPAAWQGKRTVLHFGAVDFESEVFVNGKSVGTHRGGYLPFSYDVTPYLTGSGPQELIVRVFDPTDDAGEPRGKQSIRPGGIMYTPTTGIWQTVWLEPVSPISIKDLKIVPNIDTQTVSVTVNPSATSKNTKAVVTVLASGKVVRTVSGAPGKPLSIPVPNPTLWSPTHPYLYTLSVKMVQNGVATDVVHSYFGMRKISLGLDHGVKKMLLNNKFVFQIGPLDQGFWPDGLYTQPTEAALKFDIATMKRFGFNMVRKHIKVEPARWYYWTDKLGLLVWQDMPSANSYTDRPQPIDKPEYKTELRDMVTALQNVPSIIMWDTFNEGQGQHDTVALVDMVQKMDPSRLVNEASGGSDMGSGDVHDIHSYPPPNCPPPSATRALACGEYGGIGYVVRGHQWADPGAGYTNVPRPRDLEELYAQFMGQLKTFRDERGLSAAVYTQITDVETEVNGLLTYDRQFKCDPKEIALANHFQYPVATYKPVIPTSETISQRWKYTLTKPGDDWYTVNFDDTAWTPGAGGFGTDPPGRGLVGTPWTTDDIWIRRSFLIPNLTPLQVSRLVLRDYHDEDVEVYINGVKAYSAPGFIGSYENQPLSAEARQAIRPGQVNYLSVHCHQTIGGQYIDVGLSERIPPPARR